MKIRGKKITLTFWTYKDGKIWCSYLFIYLFVYLFIYLFICVACNMRVLVTGFVYDSS